MDNYSKIYWLTRLDSIHTFFSILVGLCMAVLVIYHIVLFVNSDLWDEDESKEYKKNWKKYKMGSFWFGLIAAIALVFLPTKTDVIMIYAGGKTMDFINQDTSINKIPYQTTKIISDYLDTKIKEVSK